VVACRVCCVGQFASFLGRGPVGGGLGLGQTGWGYKQPLQDEGHVEVDAVERHDTPGVVQQLGDLVLHLDKVARQFAVLCHHHVEAFLAERAVGFRVENNGADYGDGIVCFGEARGLNIEHQHKHLVLLFYWGGVVA